MKKTLKLALLGCAALLACALMFTSCNDEGSSLLHTHEFGEWTVIENATCIKEGKEERVCECGKKETQSIAKNKQHEELVDKIDNASFEQSYSELYAIYSSAVSHQAECNCHLYLANLLKSMLYGEWKDASGNYINYTYVYSDYNNTSGETWYGTNLPTSKISGNTYYYYTEVEGKNLIIGYEDKITEEKTDNFIISFKQNGISISNEINNKTYELPYNASYAKVQKGNAKLAYIYIAKQIFSFKYPASVKVTSCYVDYETKEVYATIQATNGFGGTNNTDYKLYETNGSYYITEYSHNYSTNVDLTELNEKLQALVSSGG